VFLSPRKYDDQKELIAMRRRFVTLDVFTDRRFAGNPLAVVLDAEGIETEVMQAVAREFNLSETVFVLPPADRAHRARIRILTPARELPFAGHPTVGAAVLLGRGDGEAGVRDIVLEEAVGLIRCHVHTIDQAHGRAHFSVPKLPFGAGPASETETIAAALSLAANDIGFGAYRPQRWSAGLAFTFVPVRSREAIARASPEPTHFESAFGQDGPGMAYLFCAETVEAGNSFHARMFAPGYGVREDPATGSAAAAMAGLIAATEHPADGLHDYRIEQGYEMGRPSLIELGLTVKDGALAAVEIGGHAVTVSEGTIEA
jgi:trans-2,3-dihydro-3-hydroxyanthranilate isomerase